MAAPVAVRRLISTLAALLLAWCAGFGWFIHAAERDGPVLPKTVDGIVVLTGGAERVATALQLLAEGRAPVLLVSGVGHGADLSALPHGPGLSADGLAKHVTLGRSATTTAENAAETAVWARENGVRSLAVVTAGYHMPRALLELRRALPEVALYPVPVQPPAMRKSLDPATWRLLAGEYTKWIAVRLGVAPLLRHEPSRGALA